MRCESFEVHLRPGPAPDVLWRSRHAEVAFHCPGHHNAGALGGRPHQWDGGSSNLQASFGVLLKAILDLTASPVRGVWFLLCRKSCDVWPRHTTLAQVASFLARAECTPSQTATEAAVPHSFPSLCRFCIDLLYPAASRPLCSAYAQGWWLPLIELFYREEHLKVQNHLVTVTPSKGRKHVSIARFLVFRVAEVAFVGTTQRFLMFRGGGGWGGRRHA